ncbi:MAG: phage tail tape measure protein, partial [Muribaculaceae bacterium]|nr:phage tail tape measure protein [Muribaculaceae bacterium]
MAKTIDFNIKLNSNGEAIMGKMTMSAKQLSAAVAEVQKSVKETTTEAINSFSSMTFVFENCAKGVTQLAEPFRSFDQAMRAANTMAGKSAEDFGKLKDEVKALSKEIPIARDLLANGLYQTISNGVPEDNWISFLEASARSSVGGMANLEEVVKVTSTVIKNYGYSWEEAAAIQDKIQLTAKNGVTSFEQLAQALPRVTGNAATLGVQIDELMATFSTLTCVSGNTAEVSPQLAA